MEIACSVGGIRAEAVVVGVCRRRKSGGTRTSDF